MTKGFTTCFLYLHQRIIKMSSVGFCLTHPNRPSSASTILCSHALLLRKPLSKMSSSFWFQPKNSVMRRSGSSSLLSSAAAMPMIKEYNSIRTITSYCQGETQEWSDQATTQDEVNQFGSWGDYYKKQSLWSWRIHILSMDCPLEFSLDQLGVLRLWCNSRSLDAKR